MTPSSEPCITVVVPFYNAEATLARCLEPLLASVPADTEILAVDDGSTDDSVAIAQALGVRVVRNQGAKGPSAARNAGARAGRGRWLVMIDADVYVKPDTVRRLVAELDAGAVAVFGSYTPRPVHTNFASLFKNLQFCFAHEQGGRCTVAHFWSGCGAVDRQSFLALGGFDPSRRYIEDGELGMRLARHSSGKIVLDPSIQATHAKHYGWWELVRSDFLGRAIPFSELVIRNRHLPDAVSVNQNARRMVITAWFVVGSALLAVPVPALAWVPLAAAGLFVKQSWPFLSFVAREAGTFMAVVSLPQWFLFNFYSGLGFACAAAQHIARRRAVQPRSG